MSENRHIRRSLERSRAAAPRLHPASLWAIILMGVIALAIQSFVVQTHIHIPQNGAGKIQTVSLVTLAATVADGVLSPNAPAPRDKFPITEDPSNCPLCQEFAHSGQFMASAAALAALPATATFSVILFAEAAPYIFAASHTWRERAPPL